MSHRTKLVALAACALLFAAVASFAVIVVSYTLYPVVANDCTSLSVTRQTDGAGGLVLLGTFNFDVKDGNGVVRETGSATVQLTPEQAAAMVNLVNGIGVPAFNTQRGL